MDVVLAGLMLPNVQNHSLARLAGAAGAAGFRAGLVPFRGFPDIDGVTAFVGRTRPRLVGVSMQTTEAALASVTLIEMLRRSGYRGLVVVGGHFATLNAEGLLREVPAIDLVVRFAGEAALVALLRDGGGPGALPSVPGLAYRGEGGSVRFGGPPLLDSPEPAGPGAEALPVHLGFPAADLVASRGCQHHCAYCCVAGVSDLAAESGGPRSSRREAGALADEIAALFHGRGARVFNFMDDNLLPSEPAEARAWVGTLEAALRARGVGRIAFSLQLRADVCSPEVVAALADLGLCRSYVGIDGYSGRQLVALGRDAPGDAGFSALARLSAAGIFSVCNALIIGPTFAFASIRREIEALAGVREAPVHLLPIDVRAGSSYFDRVQRRGLLEGGLLWRRYRFADPRTARLAEAVTAFPTRLEEYSVPIALYDLGYNLGIARRLVPEADVGDAAAAYREVTARWNSDQVRVLRGAAAAAEGDDGGAVARFVADESERVRALDDELRAACGLAMRAVERAVSRARRVQVRVHTRGQLLSTVALSMALAACDRRQPLVPRDGAVDPPARALPAREVAADLPPDRVEVASPCGEGSTATPTDASPPGVICCGNSFSAAQISFDDRGNPTGVAILDAGSLSTSVRDCILQTLSRYCYPSLAGTTQTLANSHCWVA